MPGKNTDLETLLKNIQEGLQTYSVQELNEAIVSFLSKKHDKNAEVNFVLDEVAGMYSISRRTLTHSSARGEIQQAKKLSYCLLHYNVGLTIRHIAMRIFPNKFHNGVGVAIKEFRNLNEAIKFDREFKEKYELIQKKLMLFINKKNQNGDSALIGNA